MKNKQNETNTIDLSRRKTMTALALGAATLPITAKMLSETEFKSPIKPMLVNEKGPFDIVISGGHVVDPETGLDAIRNVGIKGNRIAAVSKGELQGKRIIDASKQIVSPGFIDLHAHGQELPAMWVRAFDGVTTALELESGLLPISRYYSNMENDGGRPINYGAGSGWATARVMVMEKGNPNLTESTADLAWFQKAFSFSNWQNTIASEEQLEEILALVEEGVNEGGLGISINGGYAPGYGRKEYYELAKLAKKYEVATYTHDRYMSVLEPQSAFEALGEQIGLSAITGAHMHICHLNSVAGRDIKYCAKMIKEAQDNGVKVTVEAYPYGGFSTAIGAEFLRGSDYLKRFGVTEMDAMEMNGTTLSQSKIDDLQQQQPGAVVNFHFLGQPDLPGTLDYLDQSVLFPGGAIASDAMPWVLANGTILTDDVWPLPDDAFSHPRSAGCFSRFIGKWAQERSKISLLDAIAKCTLIPADILGDFVPQMKKKGRIQVGADADILIFDMDKINSKADFVNPRILSTGHNHVMVNGEFIISNGERVVKARPGQAIRRAVKK